MTFQNGEILIFGQNLFSANRGKSSAILFLPCFCRNPSFAENSWSASSCFQIEKKGYQNNSFKAEYIKGAVGLILSDPLFMQWRVQFTTTL